MSLVIITPGKNSLRTIVGESIREVTRFYMNQGIDVRGTFSFRCATGAYDHDRKTTVHIPAMSRKLLPMYTEKTRSFLRTEIPRVSEGYGITFSEAAVEEQVDLHLERTMRMSGLTDAGIGKAETYGADIVVYQPLIDSFREWEPHGEKAQKEIVERTMAYAAWQVIETRSDLPASEIVFGTSEFARNSFIQTHQDYSRPAVATPKGASAQAIRKRLAKKDLRRLGLDIVRSHARTLPDLLDREKRAAMADEMDRRLIARAKMRNNATTPQALQERGTLNREKFPELNVLDDEFTRETLLRVYEEIGLALTTKELEGQDLSGLLEHYAEMGYGVRRN